MTLGSGRLNPPNEGGANPEAYSGGKSGVFTEGGCFIEFTATSVPAGEEAFVDVAVSPLPPDISHTINPISNRMTAAKPKSRIRKFDFAKGAAILPANGAARRLSEPSPLPATELGDKIRLPEPAFS